MLDVAVEKLSFHYPKSQFLLHELGLLFPKQTHTILAGPGGAGKTTLLRLIAGELHTRLGIIRIGSREVNALKASARPLLYVRSDTGLPPRWSAQHILIAAARQRAQKEDDFDDRIRQVELAQEKWDLKAVSHLRSDQLSQSERCRVQLARIEILRPAILMAERLLAGAAASEADFLADQFYRTLRVIGTTLINEPARLAEQRYADRMVILESGSLIQEGSIREVHDAPQGAVAAAATGPINLVPIRISSNRVESPIGGWEVRVAPFQGDGTALIRPEHFVLAAAGESSDFIFSVEEAGFDRGVWFLSGFISGGGILRVTIPSEVPIHKGKLLPLRFDPSRARLVSSFLRTRQDPFSSVPGAGVGSHGVRPTPL
ncbi:MAG TPA: ATP-binding cassette domain-containing protein [Thermoanaerobaculia bacterium]|nr:ATP-binding cassette domain-containing protein [Thermoanaerobaculia bacterium]